MTTQGASGPLPSADRLDAARACLLYGNVRIVKKTSDNEVLRAMHNGDAAAYKYLDFSGREDSVRIIAFPGKKGITVDLALDASWGRSIGRINIPGNGDGSKAQIFKTRISSSAGVHSVWLRFWGDGDENTEIDEIEFF
jgi:hypothetical protein